MDGKMQKVGDWNKVKYLIRGLRKNAQHAIKISLLRIGKQGVKVSKGHIDSQDLAWKPLAASTVAQKASQNKDPRILVSSNRYYDSITYKVQGNGVFIGVPKGAQTEQGESLVVIAAVHEFGALSKNIEARPLWQPTGSELVEWAKDNANPAKILLDALKLI